jgi:hypothetical protein
MAKKKLILIPSERMDNNKKDGRNEHGLVRMSKAARTNMGFKDDVEVFPATSSTEDRLRGAMMLKIFHAFSADIKAAKAAGVTVEDIHRVGFVTTKTYNKVTGATSTAGPAKNVFITDDHADTVIGADPEFLLFTADGQIVKANHVMAKPGPIGSDGAMAEVRPDPSASPEGLVSNIRKIFSNKSLVKVIEPYNWMAGCYYKDSQRDYPIGGHIHIGNPTKIAKISLDNRERFFRSFNKIMDELLAIPMTKIDGTDLASNRRTKCQVTGNSNHGFGFFGEFRTCAGRLEHRSLSGMWLMHPDLAVNVFGVAKAIIDEVYKHVRRNDYKMDYMYPSKFNNINVWGPSFDKWNEIPLTEDMGCVTTSDKMMDMLHSPSASKLSATYLKNWYHKMRGLSTYSSHSKYIDSLYEILKVNMKTFQDFDKRIQSNWLEGKKFL